MTSTLLCESSPYKSIIDEDLDHLPSLASSALVAPAPFAAVTKPRLHECVPNLDASRPTEEQSNLNFAAKVEWATAIEEGVTALEVGDKE